MESYLFRRTAEEQRKGANAKLAPTKLWKRRAVESPEN
jgi:hypothetical protein